MKRFVAMMVLVAACHSGDKRPAFDDKLLAPAAKGLKVGVATLDDVTKAFPGAEVKKDKSLGGTGTVEFNEHKAIAVDAEGVEAYIVDGKLEMLSVHDAGLLDWLVKTMDTMPGSKACPGNRKMGKSGEGEAAYCASAGDRVVFIDASKGSDRDELSYHLAK